MAKVEWSAGIDSVSGALSKPSKSGQHSCTKMLLGTHRVAETTSDQCTRLYLRKKIKRKTAPSTDELAKRERFASISRAVNTRMHDLSKITTDQAAYVAQRDQAGGKKSLKSYIWSLEKAAYDQAHS